LGIGDWGLGPIPNPQSPIPNPQSPIPMEYLFLLYKLFKLIHITVNNFKFLKIIKEKNNLQNESQKEIFIN
jgi:hypothetical protein